MSSSSLGAFRWALGLWLLVGEAPYSAWIHQLPSGLFDPQVASQAYWVSGFPPWPTFWVLDALQLLCLLCVTLGYRTRWASLAYVGLEVLTSNFRFSFGKLDRDFLPAAAIFCMAFSNWGAFYSLDSRRTREKAAPTPLADERSVALVAVLVAFGMFSAGLPKLVNWVDFDLGTSGFLAWYLSNFFGIGRTYLLAPAVQYVPRLSLELLDYMAPIGELLGFVTLLWSRRAWLAWLAAVVGFHLTTALFLNIAFTGFVIVYLVFVDVNGVWPKLRNVSPMLGKALGGVAVITTLLQVLAHLTGWGGSIVLVPEPLQYVVGLYLFIPIAVAALALFGVGWMHQGRIGESRTLGPVAEPSASEEP